MPWCLCAFQFILTRWRQLGSSCSTSRWKLRLDWILIWIIFFKFTGGHLALSEPLCICRCNILGWASVCRKYVSPSYLPETITFSTVITDITLFSVRTDESLFLMATCYYRCGKMLAAYSVLHNSGSKNPQCKFLLAKCCVDLAKLVFLSFFLRSSFRIAFGWSCHGSIFRLAEAEMILVGKNSVCSKNLDGVNQEYAESGCFALQLVGEICRKSERRAKACDAYSKSVKLNPFLWTSYKSLCDLGLWVLTSDIRNLNFDVRCRRFLFPTPRLRTRFVENISSFKRREFQHVSGIKSFNIVG